MKIRDASQETLERAIKVLNEYTKEHSHYSRHDPKTSSLEEILDNKGNLVLYALYDEACGDGYFVTFLDPDFNIVAHYEDEEKAAKIEAAFKAQIQKDLEEDIRLHPELMRGAPPMRQYVSALSISLPTDGLLFAECPKYPKRT